MNLIANTGIQLFNFSLEIDFKDNFKMYFHEWEVTDEKQIKLEIAHFFPDSEIWIKKQSLINLGFAKPEDNYFVKEDWDTISRDPDFEIEKSRIHIVNQDPIESGCFDVSFNKIQENDWRKFENTWLPMPFFKVKGRKTDFGPTNWCRFKLLPVSVSGNIKKYNLLLAFDTRSVFKDEGFEEEDLQETPIFTNLSQTSNDYALCNTEEGLISYCSEEMNCGWVDSYLLNVFHHTNDINDKNLKRPKLKYLAQYVFLLRYIEINGNLPSITLFSNLNTQQKNVDLVVDIGNSRTCAVLFDDGDFNLASPLELQDFSHPVAAETLNVYKDSFDMRLAFREADFGGRMGITNSKQFVFPSMVRLGIEANDLIHKSTNMNTGAEKTSTFSSPKRFLWDEQLQELEWEFVQLEGENSDRPIYIQGISEQLNEDGTLGGGAAQNRYSRKSLMTLAFLEILAQANLQINSYEQRKHWGEEPRKRKINRIIVTCPTAMSRVEQIALRKCAEDASIILDRFFSEGGFYSQSAEVIPSTKNLIRNLNNTSTEWIYDEATAAQFMFIYAEVNERYQGNVKEFFEFYGKPHADQSQIGNKSLTVGSVDIGAGTTDVMIAQYQYANEEIVCSLTPVPLFWESFYFAGDDLMKSLVQLLVIEGDNAVLEHKLRVMGKNPIDILQPFLGAPDNGVSIRNRRLRSDFNLQVSVPVVSKYLELLRNNEGDKILSYSDIWDNKQPSHAVSIHFRESFGFDLSTLQWPYKKKVVSDIIEKTFDSLIGKISSLLSFYQCDIVLLSGRPTSLKPLSDLFLKYYAVSPNRMKCMNDYRVGRWYPEDKRNPFIDGNGKFINPKSIITTGAMIGNLAQSGGLGNFKLNLTELNHRLLPTSQYFGILHSTTLSYIKTIISPTHNNATEVVPALPARIGIRQLDIPSYPSRPFYKLDFNKKQIEDRVRGRIIEDTPPDMIVRAEVEAEIKKIKAVMPLTLTISRIPEDDLEKLILEEVQDRDGNTLPNRFFILQVQSMSENANYWLDTGLFNLNINHI